MDETAKSQIRRDVENELRHLVQDARREFERAAAAAQTDSARESAEREYKQTMETTTMLAREMFQTRLREVSRSQQPSRTFRTSPEHPQHPSSVAAPAQMTRYHLTDPGVQRNSPPEVSGRPSRPSPPGTKQNSGEEDAAGDADEDSSEGGNGEKKSTPDAARIQQPVPGPSRPTATRAPPARTARPTAMAPARTTTGVPARSTPQIWKPSPESVAAPSGVTQSLQRTTIAPAKTTNTTVRGAPAAPARGVKAGTGRPADHPRIGARAGASSNISPPDVQVPSASSAPSTQRTTSGAPPARAVPAQRTTSTTPRTPAPASSAAAARRIQPTSSSSARPQPIKTAASASTSTSTPTRPVPIPAAASKSTHLAPPPEKITGPSGSLSSAHSWSEVDDGVSGSSHGSAHIVYTGPKGSRRRDTEKTDEHQKTSSESLESESLEAEKGSFSGKSDALRAREEALGQREDGVRTREAGLRVREEQLQQREATFLEDVRRRDEEHRVKEASVQASMDELHRAEGIAKLRESVLIQKELEFKERVAEATRQAEERRQQDTALAKAAEEEWRSREEEWGLRAEEHMRKRAEAAAEDEARRHALEEDQERLKLESEQLEAERLVIASERSDHMEEYGVFRARVEEFESWREKVRATAEAHERDLQRREAVIQSRELSLSSQQHSGDVGAATGKDGVVDAADAYEALRRAFLSEAYTLEREAAALDLAVVQDYDAIAVLEAQLQGLEASEHGQQLAAEAARREEEQRRLKEEEERMRKERARHRRRADSVTDAYTWFK
ncbi:hypothetical protein PENSPDRAFT_684056 [Peniophora sp. CONT]|nr:hypothetical protein PENSPDRAFT_684056 [Peniophora sp. CONT]